MWYLYSFVLLAGVANAVQAGQNGTLSKGLSQSLTAGLVVVAGTASCILIVGLLTGRLTWPTIDQASQSLTQKFIMDSSTLRAVVTSF
jgi:transporter family-2 protein